MGEHLRKLKEESRKRGSIDLALAPLVNTGYVDDEFILQTFRRWIVDKLQSRFLVLDGIPRKILQARRILPYLKCNGGYEVNTLWFSTPATVCMSRPSRDNREDDSPDKILKRMEDFDEMTQPMYDLLRVRTRMLDIDNSNREIHAVREEIAEFLKLTHILSSAA